MDDDLGPPQVPHALERLVPSPMHSPRGPVTRAGTRSPRTPGRTFLGLPSATAGPFSGGETSLVPGGNAVGHSVFFEAASSTAVRSDLLRDTYMLLSSTKAEEDWDRGHYASIFYDTQAVAHSPGHSTIFECFFFHDSNPSLVEVDQRTKASYEGWQEGPGGPGTGDFRLCKFLEYLASLEGKWLHIRIAGHPHTVLFDKMKLAASRRGYIFDWFDMTPLPASMTKFVRASVHFDDVFTSYDPAHHDLSLRAATPLLPTHFFSNLITHLEGLGDELFDPLGMQRVNPTSFRLVVGSALAYCQVHLRAAHVDFNVEKIGEAFGEYGVHAAAMVKAAILEGLIAPVGGKLVDACLSRLLPASVQVGGQAAMEKDFYAQHSAKKAIGY